MAEANQRLFFALWPAPAVARRLHAAARDAHAGCGGRLMRLDTLHMTLAFLGEVAVACRAQIEAAACGIAFSPFVLEVDRIGYWRHNRILWAGCSSAPPGLNLLADALADNLRAAGFALEERPFAAHATLLRTVGNAPRELPPLQPIVWPVADFALVASHRSVAGSRYEVLRRWALAPA